VLIEEGFGFIETKEIGDVFFHKSQYAGFKKARKGESVTCEVNETAKGKAATNIATNDMTAVTRVKEGFIMARAGEPKSGRVIKRVRIQSNYFIAPYDAREHLKDLAINAGCNAVLKIEIPTTICC
jgi:cold shock CspA family protein